jgi:hypothetical protein
MYGDLGIVAALNDCSGVGIGESNRASPAAIFEYEFSVPPPRYKIASKWIDIRGYRMI